MSTVVQAYQFALDPTLQQDMALRSHCGGQRYAYNWGLAQVKANLAQREAERSYGIDTDELTPSLNWSAYSLRKTWNQAKHDVAPWWAENSKEAYSSGLANLATALGNWSDSRAGKRCGPKVRFPRFKGKRTAMSCRFTTGAFGLADTDRRHVKLPRIGLVRTHESTRKLARHVERGTVRIRSVTVSHQRGRWFVSLSVEITRDDPTPTRPGTAVGVDLGIKSLAVLSTGEVIANPRHVHVADRWYPSSKTCSDCGAVKAKLRLSERTYTCDQCGLLLDRDLNAARNLAALVSVVTGGDGGELRRDSPMETHIRPAPCGQRVPPREDPLGQRPHRKERTQDAISHVS